MKYNPDGTISIVQVSATDSPHGLFDTQGRTRVTTDVGQGVYAPNGSLRVADQGEGAYAPSGALNGTLTTTSFKPRYQK